MTTEIAIMNSSAVVLAADSAVTIRVNGGKITYHGVDKIMGVVHQKPIAVMVNGQSDFWGVPWEVIIRCFRDGSHPASKQSEPRNRNSLQAYCLDFMDYFEKFCEKSTDRDAATLPCNASSEIIGVIDSSSSIESFVRSEYKSIKSGMLKYAEDMIDNVRADDADLKGTTSDEKDMYVRRRVLDAFKIYIDMRVNELINYAKDALELKREKNGAFSFVTQSDIDAMLNGKGKVADIFKDEFSEKFMNISEKLEDNAQSLLKDLCKKIYLLPSLTLMAGKWRHPYSSLIFTGYGDDEIMPQLIKIDFSHLIVRKSILRTEFEIDLLAASAEAELLGVKREEIGKTPRVVCYSRVNMKKSISKTEKAVFEPFGERDIVDVTLNGMSGSFTDEIQSEIKNLISKSSKELSNIRSILCRECLQKIDATDTQIIENLLEKKFEALSEKMKKISNKYRSSFLETISYLPKHHLGDIAKNMVILSSIKSHVRDVEGTVAGPVSVAVISKGDGLVWVERPTYFKANENPQFMARYPMNTRRGHRYEET